MPKWIKFTSPSSTGIIDAYIEIESSDIVYITRHNNVIYFPQHGSRKIIYNGHSEAKAREWLEKFLEREEQKDREKAWIDNKGNTRMDVEESKIAENKENQ